MIKQARALLEAAMKLSSNLESFEDLMELKEVVARLETRLAARHFRRELEKSGASASESYRIERRTNNWWNPRVTVEYQDLILGAMEKLSPSSDRRTEFYQLAADVALRSTPRQTHDFTKKLVREENQRLAQDPYEAYRQRRFKLSSQDEHGGCNFSGYAPAATAALFKASFDQALNSDQKSREGEDDAEPSPSGKLTHSIRCCAGHPATAAPTPATAHSSLASPNRMTLIGVQSSARMSALTWI